jgi:hypothetical protein
MANVWIEGWETSHNSQQAARKYATFSGSWQNTAPAGRVFGQAGNIASTVAVTPTFASDNTFVLGFGFRFNGNINSTANQGLYIETGTDEQFHLEIDDHATLGFRWHIYRGATLIASTSYFDYAVWHYFEIKVTVRTSTNGAYEFRHNGVADISDTGLDMADNATDGWDVFAFRFTQNHGTNTRFDDLYINNGVGATNIDFLGPSIVEGLLPNAEGATIQWTPGSGTDNSAQVDDPTSVDDVTAGGINYSDTNTHLDLYEYEDLTQITGTIHAIQLGTQLGMDVAGTRTVKTKYRDPDTTVVDGASHVVDSTAYDEFTENFDLNPNSAAAWDVTDIDDGQFGVEVVS